MTDILFFPWQANEAQGLRDLEHDQYGEDPAFSEDVFCIERVSHNQACLSLVDLPGMTRSLF